MKDERLKLLVEEELLNVLRYNSAGGGLRNLSKHADVYIDCGSWAKTLDVASCLGGEMGLIIHAGLSLTTDPVQIAVAASARQAGASVQGAVSEIQAATKALEDYGCVLNDPHPVSSPAYSCNPWAPTSACVDRAHREAMPRGLVRNRYRVADPRFRGGSDIAAVRLIPGGKSEARNTLIAVPARPGIHPWSWLP